MKVLVCGGRKFADANLLYRTLDRLHAEHGFTEVIEGGAIGADTLARNWARRRRIKVRTFHAQWFRYRKAAGPIRNAQMLDEGRPELVIAFPGGPGTRNMIEQARYHVTPFKVMEIK